MFSNCNIIIIILCHRSLLNAPSMLLQLLCRVTLYMYRTKWFNEIEYSSQFIINRLQNILICDLLRLCTKLALLLHCGATPEQLTCIWSVSRRESCNNENPHIPPHSSPHAWPRQEPTKTLCTPYVCGLSKKGVHFTRCPYSVQTSEDTEADPNETRDMCIRGEKERSCVRNPMQGM